MFGLLSRLHAPMERATKAGSCLVRVVTALSVSDIRAQFCPYTSHTSRIHYGVNKRSLHHKTILHIWHENDVVPHTIPHKQQKYLQQRFQFCKPRSTLSFFIGEPLLRTLLSDDGSSLASQLGGRMSDDPEDMSQNKNKQWWMATAVVLLMSATAMNSLHEK